MRLLHARSVKSSCSSGGVARCVVEVDGGAAGVIVLERPSMTTIAVTATTTASTTKAIIRRIESSLQVRRVQIDEATISVQCESPFQLWFSGQHFIVRCLSDELNNNRITGKTQQRRRQIRESHGYDLPPVNLT